MQPVDRTVAFAPGRVNVVGEHTDYNDGLALPFAIEAGITVRAARLSGAADVVRARALDLDQADEFAIESAARPDGGGWRAYVRGVVAELRRVGVAVAPTSIEIESSLPQGAGLSSSAALTVVLCLALLALAGEEPMLADRLAIARLCGRVEHDWAGAESGLLDQLASLFGTTGAALRIDFATLSIEPVALSLDGWRFAVLDSGERHVHASSGYNERREECRQACELLGVASLREVERERARRVLPSVLKRRVEHVLDENERVEWAIAALRAHDLETLGGLLSASHASLRDLYEVSTPAVEAAVERMLVSGAAGARIIGGGFGGSVLGLLPPGVEGPTGAVTATPGRGARLL